MAEIAFVTRQVADDFVVGIGITPGTMPVSGDSAFQIVAITLAQYAEVSQKSLRFGENYRWKMITGVLTEQTDPRARVRFSNVNVQANVGDPPPAITMSLIDGAGVVQTGINGTRQVTLNGVPTRATIVAGVANFTIATDRAREFLIGDGPNYRVEAPMRVRISNLNVL